MQKEDALALLDVLRMQIVHAPPAIDLGDLARKLGEVVARANGWRI